jgi:hypothetical protein
MSAPQNGEVYVVTQEHGLTIEGDTDIRGVYSNAAAAEEAANHLDPERFMAGAIRYEIQDTFDPARLEPSAWTS